MPPAKVFAPLPHATRNEASRTNIIALFGSVLQAVHVDEKKGKIIRMGKILHAFLTDQLRVDDGVQPQTSEHRKLSDKSDGLQNQLAEKLDDEGKEILTELVDTLFDETSVETYQKFERGYRLGVLMMVEVYSELNTFL